MPLLLVMQKQDCLQHGPMRMQADLLGLLSMFSDRSSASQILNIVGRLVTEGESRSMSSAYKMKLTHLEPRWQPLPQQMILLITLSMKIANRQGDSAPLWRTPADNLKNEVVMEPQRTQVMDDRNQFSMIHKSSTGSFLL